MGKGCVWECERNGLTLTTQWVGWKPKRGCKGHFGVFGKEAGPGYRDRTGFIFRFDLENYPDLLGPEVEWANWASTGDLLYAKEGCVFRLRKPKPGHLGEPERIDLNAIDPPPRKPRS